MVSGCGSVIDISSRTPAGIVRTTLVCGPSVLFHWPDERISTDAHRDMRFARTQSTICAASTRAKKSRAGCTSNSAKSTGPPVHTLAGPEQFNHSGLLQGSGHFSYSAYLSNVVMLGLALEYSTQLANGKTWP
jgi:hypothetical protein